MILISTSPLCLATKFFFICDFFWIGIIRIIVCQSRYLSKLTIRDAPAGTVEVNACPDEGDQGGRPKGP